ncbi:protein indeterminate-domain 5, chloroplastic-like isoform X2 [Salvia hispanica]|uniref:protein indeterminate-domain 5, chloroplastic-like isoform X2 n=1 Tax=Salvia hispanica TaxID=49212 RepID=UPI002008FDDF|nr:protein indeterminate-domain 5, chloroplastic-like isoform X2 [Salvia hispanica]
MKTSSHSSSSSFSLQQPRRRRRTRGGGTSREIQANPDAEVIALSPKTLMATNRFVCEVCNKGFQREQNLQLHRRGHNLPWKLRQKSTKEVRRKVYLCPEPSCVHHDPSRALGDLTGIKKHYSRKHGEKKYKCEKCSKKYAVHSDWKAHSKTCGTREYRCDCGTLFSRRDSFITHRAFCDALAQESARNLNAPSLTSIGSHLLGLSQHDQMNQGALSSHDILRLGRPGQQYETLVSPGGFRPSPRGLFLHPNHDHDHQDHQNQSPHSAMLPNKSSLQSLMQLPQLHMNNTANTSSNSSAAGLFNLSFFPGNNNNNAASTMDGGAHHSAAGDDSTLFSSGNLMSIAIPSLYSTSQAMQTPSGGQMSATALLQKAAQMGSTATNNGGASSSLLKSFGKSPDHHSFGGSSVYGGSNSGGGNHLHDLMMNSIAAAEGGFEQAEMEEYRGFHGGNSNSQQSGFSSLEQAGRLTRDFLGVGEIVRSVREQQSGMDHLGSLDLQGKTQPFGGGSFQ